VPVTDITQLYSFYTVRVHKLGIWLSVLLLNFDVGLLFGICSMVGHKQSLDVTFTIQCFDAVGWTAGRAFGL